MDQSREAAYRAKEKVRSLNRKTVKDMTPREHRAVKKKWRQWDEARRKRQQDVRNLQTTPYSPLPLTITLPMPRHLNDNDENDSKTVRHVREI